VPSPGTGQAEAELIRRQVARQIVEHNRTCGNVPGHLQRWAEKKLRPRVDWRRELAAAIRAAIADVAGMADYSYRRPSRRQGQVGNGKVVLPSLRRPVPEVAVIVDTSGSMSNGLLAKALAEVAGVLRATGQGAAVLAVDTTVQAVRACSTRARSCSLAGAARTWAPDWRPQASSSRGPKWPSS
jgi:predicted metal-dependent peptidase